MGTRGVLAKPHGDGWRGRHIDGSAYPTWFGKMLWIAVRDLWRGDVARFVADVIDGDALHRLYVWQHVDWDPVGVVFGLPDCPIANDHAGEWYYAAGAPEEDLAYTSDGLSDEWVYVVSPAGLEVLGSRQTGRTVRMEGAPFDGTFFFNWPVFVHERVAFVPWDWDAPDPAWEAMRAIRRAWHAPSKEDPAPCTSAA